MSVTAYAICGLLMAVALTLIIFSGKVHPIIVFSILPIIFSVICGFSVEEVGEWVETGVKGQVSTATMFMFAIMFFSCMMDTGVFDRIIGKLMGGAKSVLSVCILTVICTIIGHMDGSGATTFLLVIPSFYLVYKKMGMRPVVLVGLTTCTAGVMNQVPWAGNAGRAAAGLGITPNEVFAAALPGFLVGIACCFGLACLFARWEMKRGAGVPAGMNLRLVIEEGKGSEAGNKDLLRPNLFWVNLALIAVTILVIFAVDAVPTFLVFAVASGLALVINYPGTKAQTERLKEYAPSCMTMAAVVLATGIYTGILNNSPMIKSIGELVVSAMNENIAAHLNTILGFLWGPLSTLGLGHTSTCNGILPLVHSIGANYVTKAQVGGIYINAFSPRVFCDPKTAAMFVALGLANVDLKEHLKFSLFWSHMISFAGVAGSILFGAVPF